MTNTNILDLENRRRIYNCILKNPGLHQRNLSKKLRIPFSTLYYHLKYLEKSDRIIEKKIGRYSRYYTRNTVGMGDKELLNIIRQNIPRNIILFLITMYVTSQKELSINLDKHRTTIKVHLKKLLDMNIIEIAPVKNWAVDNNRPNGPIVERKPVTNETLYRIKDRILIDKLLTTHKDSFMKDKAFNAACYLFEDTITTAGTPKKLKPIEYYVDKAIECIYDIFPHPYHV